MGQLIIPNEIKINGPWILEESQLEELDEVLRNIDEKLNESYEIELEREIEKELPDLLKWNEKVTREQARDVVENRYPFKIKEKYAMLLSKDGKRLTDVSLLGLLKDKNIRDFNPYELQVGIKKGPISFILEITTRYDGELQTRLISEDSVANDINHLLNKWIRKNRPIATIQFWSLIFPFALFPLFFLLLFSSVFFLKSEKVNYNEELKKEGKALLINGIDDSELNRTLEIILKLETDYTPANYTKEPILNSTIIKIWIYGTICIVLLSISPKTTIGVGKKKRSALFYKKWIYIVTIFIPLTIILPIIKAKIF